MKTPGHAMTAQAGAAAYIDLADTPYGRGWTTSREPLQMPVGRYLHESAAVPVEALEGLVSEMDEFLDAEYEPNLDTIQKWSNELARLIERSKELIKERSNG